MGDFLISHASFPFVSITATTKRSCVAVIGKKDHLPHQFQKNYSFTPPRTNRVFSKETMGRNKAVTVTISKTVGKINQSQVNSSLEIIKQKN